MKLLKHLAGYLPVKLANAVAAFGGVYIFTRLLTAEDYGRYALMFTVLALVHTLTLTPTEAAAYRFTSSASAKGTLAQHFRTMLALTLRSLAVAYLILIGLAACLWKQPEYLAILPWLAGLMTVNTFIQIGLEAHRALQQVQRYAIIETLRILGGIILGALIAWKTGFGSASPFVGMFIAGICLVIAELHWLISRTAGARSDGEARKKYLKYGIPIAGALVLDQVLSAADRFLIAYFLGEASVGEYAAGYGVADKTVLLLCAWAAIAASPLIMDAFENKGPEAAKKEALGMARTLLLVGLPAAFGIAFVAEPLAEALIGEQVRAGAMQIIPWIAFAGLLNGLLVHYFSDVFQLVHRTGERALIMLIPVVLNIVLNLVLIPNFALMGAVYATVISYAVGVIAMAGFGRRLLALPIPLVDLMKLLVAAGAMWPVIQLVPDWGSWPELGLKIALGGLVYVSLAVLLDAGGARAFLAQRFSSSETLGSS